VSEEEFRCGAVCDRARGYNAQSARTEARCCAGRRRRSWRRGRSAIV